MKDSRATWKWKIGERKERRKNGEFVRCLARNLAVITTGLSTRRRRRRHYEENYGFSAFLDEPRHMSQLREPDFPGYRISMPFEKRIESHTRHISAHVRVSLSLARSLRIRTRSRTFDSRGIQTQKTNSTREIALDKRHVLLEGCGRLSTREHARVSWYRFKGNVEAPSGL